MRLLKAPSEDIKPMKICFDVDNGKYTFRLKGNSLQILHYGEPKTRLMKKSLYALGYLRFYGFSRDDEVWDRSESYRLKANGLTQKHFKRLREYGLAMLHDEDDKRYWMLTVAGAKIAYEIRNDYSQFADPHPTP
jgi:hypothetical protein